MSSNPISGTTESIEVATPTESKREKEYVNGPISFRQQLRRLLWHVVARQFTLLCVITLVVASWFGRRRRRLLPGEGCEIMLTGQFYSDNWIRAFLGPLSASKECCQLWMVSTNPVPALPKVAALWPPKWLVKTIGLAPARLLTFACAAMQKRPHIVGGFHIKGNGIAAIIVGRLIGARSVYFCVGGPVEVCDGGVHTLNNMFAKMETADAVVESRLLRIVAASDMVITMGTKAAEFFRDKGVDADLYVVSGGIDPMRFPPAVEASSYDLILTAYLTEVKRVDVFLRAVKYIVDKLPSVKAVIVGGGPLRGELDRMAKDFGIDRNVCIVGYQDDIVSWLQKSKVFVLTSDSEGLSLAMIEAMMCGLPAVVSDVGDLRDLVKNGVNGYLVPRRSPDLFAERIIELLSDEQKLKAFSQAARHSALQYTTEATAAKWDNIIEYYRTS
jgi:glycosyltransferase involved in cell wall biosynthesis